MIINVKIIKLLIFYYTYFKKIKITKRDFIQKIFKFFLLKNLFD